MAPPENNSSILDRIRLLGSNDYQQRVPAATQAGVARVINTLNSPANHLLFNEFVDSLITQIGTQLVRSKEWENPLAKFKRIPVTDGRTIQEIGLNLIKAKAYNQLDTDLFDVNRPDAKVAYHSVNRKDRYDITVIPDQLQNAFNSPDGLSRFLDAVLLVPLTSNNYDEYRIMLNLLAEYDEKWGFFNVQVPDIFDVGATPETVREFLEVVRTQNSRLTFLSTAYNAFGVPTHTAKNSANLITTPEVWEKLAVQTWSAAYNLEFAELVNEVVLVDELPVEDALMLLVDEDFFVAGDWKKENHAFFNGKTLATNHYLHVWSILSVSPFMNAVKFTTEADTVIPLITVTPEEYTLHLTDEDLFEVDEITPGSTLAVGILSADVDPENRKVTGALLSSIITVDQLQTDADVNIPLTEFTYVDRLGYIHLQEDALAPGTKVTITATSTYNGNGVGEAAIPVTKTETFVVAGSEPDPGPDPDPDPEQ